MNKKLLKIKKAIEKIEEIENLIVDARKTINWNRDNLRNLRQELYWKKSNNIDFSSTQRRIDELMHESSWQREWIKDAKVEKQEIENSLNFVIK
jgi:uncharacterized coiled-coil protein SlyX